VGELDIPNQVDNLDLPEKLVGCVSKVEVLARGEGGGVST
jgi:hypothetical protein